jgi:hypothetical protein
VTDESLIREVDEEVRQEEYKKLWDRYGTLWLAVAAAIVLGVGGLQAWRYYEQRQSEDAAVVYFDALRKSGDGKIEDALAALKAVSQPGYGQLAKLEEAALLAEQGDRSKSVAAYDAIAADPNVNPVLQDLARIHAGYILADTVKPDELLTRLGRYDKEGNAWRHQAREVFGLAAYRTGDMTMADRYMKSIATDPETPAAMRQRAQMMVQLIAPRLPPK